MIGGEKILMKKKLIFLSVLLAFCSSLTLLLGSTDKDSRELFYVKTVDAHIRGEFPLLYESIDRKIFATKLTIEEVEGLKEKGIEVILVQKRYLSMGCSGSGNGDDPSPPPDNVSEKIPWGVRAIYNDDTLVPIGGYGVRVAVLDSGADITHVDLAANIVDCIYILPDGWGETCEDVDGHGTWTAGIVAAKGNGIYGVAPDADLMIVKVCSGGGCFGSAIASGIRWAVDNGANIISMSFGGKKMDVGETEAIQYAYENGVLLVASAGNSGPIYPVSYPAADWRVVAVGAIDEVLSPAIFSSRGINNGDYIIEEGEVEFAAPGVNVWSTGISAEGYEEHSGTSASCPHIAGLAAKLWQDSADETRLYLQNRAIDLWDEGDDIATGFGMPVVIKGWVIEE